MLNVITPETVKSSITEIKDGIRISLDWPLDKPSHPAFDRQRFSHEILNKAPMAMNDDEIRINTQSSTQLVLMGHPKWQATIAFQTGAVTLADLHAIINEHDIVLRPADILFIRVGFTAEYEKLSTQEKQDFSTRKPGGLLGLEANRDTLRWLWNNQFAAIASDAAGFERGPATGTYNDPDVSIHQWCLAGWGMPIGELFDLEELAGACRERKRYTFFLQSTPLKIPGGVASLANAVAFL
ncbi:hypothetical protein PMIN06_009470 [Paraphaeosphaeria minitans]